jgi:hypothetical protein
LRQRTSTIAIAFASHELLVAAAARDGRYSLGW